MSAPRRKRVAVPHPTDPTLALIPCTRGYWAVVDAAYASEIEKYLWSARAHGKTAYASTNTALVNGVPMAISLHRFVAYLAGMDMSGLIDHRDRNGLDCRERNLRPATRSTNAQNRGIDRNNTSGVKGVHYETYTGRWRAELWVGGKHLRLGRYTTIEAAAKAVRDARLEHHGEFACLGDEEPVLQ
jgi:hypothetical protein